MSTFFFLSDAWVFAARPVTSLVQVFAPLRDGGKKKYSVTNKIK